jgi:hypothetical protein
VNVLTSSFSPQKTKIIPELTLVTADALLKKNGQNGLSEQMRNQSIDQIVSKLLLFQGIFFSSGDLPSSRCLLKEFAAKQVERLMNTLSMIYRESACQLPLTTDNDYFFYNQKKIRNEHSGNRPKVIPSSIVDMVGPSSIDNNPDYDTAFSFLQPKKSIIPNLWSTLLSELRIEEADDLKDRDIHCLTGLAGFLHEMPFKSFCAALHLDIGVFDIEFNMSLEILDSIYSILSQPKRSSCPKCWKALLEELSVEEASDLPIVGSRVLSGLIGLLKPTQVKAVHDMLHK